MKLHILPLIILATVLFSTPVAAQTPTQTQTPVPMTVSYAWLRGYREDTSNPAVPVNLIRTDAGFGDWVLVQVENLSDAIQKDKINPRDMVLYLNGQALKGVKVTTIDGPKQNWLGFYLQRTDDSNQAWRGLLGSPVWSDNHRLMSVSVGFPDKQALPVTPSYQPAIYLRVYYRKWAVISFIVLIAVIAAFIYLAREKGLIRDSDPPVLPEGKKKPYSLALTQAAWWFFIVIASFIFIYMITGDFNTVTDQALILIGIGTGTALGSFMVNATKRNAADTDLSTLNPAKAKLEAEIQQLTAAANDPVTLAEKRAQLVELNKKIDDAIGGLSKPVSEGFLTDLLTDVNGITVHRFQMMVWTMVLGVIFVVGVYRELAMPAFSTTLLALMGISAGTYLGFKIPERQN